VASNVDTKLAWADVAAIPQTRASASKRVFIIITQSRAQRAGHKLLSLALYYGDCGIVPSKLQQMATRAFHNAPVAIKLEASPLFGAMSVQGLPTL